MEPGTSGSYENNDAKRTDNFIMPPFSEREALDLERKLVVKESRIEAIKTLICWLERGECTDLNSALFFSLIEKAYSQDLLKEVKEFKARIKRAEEKINIVDDTLNKIMYAIDVMAKSEMAENLEKPDKAVEASLKYNFASSERYCFIISLTSVLLYDHPEGLNVKQIHYDLNQSHPKISISTYEIENVLRESPQCFKTTEEGKWVNFYGSDLLKKWFLS